jgi:hypothetical protein
VRSVRRACRAERNASIGGTYDDECNATTKRQLLHKALSHATCLIMARAEARLEKDGDIVNLDYLHDAYRDFVAEAKRSL